MKLEPGWDKDRPYQVLDKVKMFDRYGRLLFEVDAWLYQEMTKRGEIQRWFA